MKIPNLKFKIKKPPKKWLIFSAVSLVSLILAAVCAIMFNASGRSLKSQQAAETWAGGSGVKYAQISVFAPSGSLDTGKIAGFRQKIISSVKDTMPKSVKNVYTDAYCAFGKTSVTGDHGSSDASVIAVGGNYFLFHPLELVSGTYFSESDVMHDRVVLDETLAWKLFGGSNLAGMTVTIGDKPFVVAGVVKRESDKSDRTAYDGGAGLYMLYDAYNSLGAASSGVTDTSSDTGTAAGSSSGNATGTGASSGTGTGTSSGAGAGTESTAAAPIVCYEVVMPNPVKAFAAGFAQTELNADKSLEIVENSSRFTSGSIYKNVLKNYGKRTMHTNGIEFPYWENAARLTENRCGVLLALRIFFLLCPAVFAIILIIKLYIHIKRKLKAEYLVLKDRYEERTLFSHMKGSDDDGGTDA
jgi:hypothetical protein